MKSMPEAIRFLIRVHNNTAVGYDSVDIAQAWAVLEEFIKTLDYIKEQQKK